MSALKPGSVVWIFAAMAMAAVLTAVQAGADTPTSNGTQPPLYYPFNPPGLCQSCHGDFDNGNNIRPHTTWSGSMMANAGRDPIFWAALDVANNEVPGIGEWCLRCHSPGGWLEGRGGPPIGSADGCGLIGDIDGSNNDFSGLHCEFCHRMEINLSPPTGQQSVYYENGQYWIDDTSCDGTSPPCRKGPYEYEMAQAHPPHPWEGSQYHRDSDNCGNCHNVTNPILTLIDENGIDTGVPVPVERTYMEWEQSSFSQPGPDYLTCQNCHMPDATHDPAYPATATDINRTGDLPIHELVGGNAWVPQVLKGEYPNLGRNAEYDATTAWAVEMLEAAATVEVSTAGFVQAGDELAIGVRVVNLSGHKLPTGYPEGRRMWLTVIVREESGAIIWNSGAWDPSTGALAQDPQLKVYEVIPGIWDFEGSGECSAADSGGNPLFHFVLNNCIVLDNRIPPAGFTGMNDIETRPVNYAYPETSPGSGILVNHDDTNYTVQIPGSASGRLTVEATLQYQTASDDYIEFLLDQAVDNGFPDDCIPRSAGMPDMSRGEILHDIWTRYNRAPPVPMATTSTLVAVGLFADGFETGDTTAWTASLP
jgi:hypothetical protein